MFRDEPLDLKLHQGRQGRLGRKLRFLDDRIEQRDHSLAAFEGDDVDLRRAPAAGKKGKTLAVRRPLGARVAAAARELPWRSA